MTLGILSILTKSCATPDSIDLSAMVVRRAAKYSLQNQALKLLPNERVRFCLRHRIDASKGVQVRSITKSHVIRSSGGLPKNKNKKNSSCEFLLLFAFWDIKTYRKTIKNL